MILTNEIILKELKKDGGLKTKTALTKFYTTQEIYNFYNNVQNKKCEICSNNTKFLNFKVGYDNVCSRSCRKKYNSNEYIPDFNNTIPIEELKQFLIYNFSKCNTSNKLNISYFVSNNYIKEINTILKYMSTICTKQLNIQLIHDLVYGCGICNKCAKPTTFIGFDNNYRLTCSNTCSKSIHINKFVNYSYTVENFIQNGKFLRTNMMKHYNVSSSFVNKWKVKNDISIENKHKKYSIGEQILFKEFSNSFNVLTNNRTIINPYEIDVVIDNLCIEYDGLLFHSNGNGFPGNGSKRFKDKLIPDGYQLLTIFENEFLDVNKRNIWLSVIRNKLGQSQKIYGRKCVIKEVDTREAKIFCDENHLQGYSNSSIKIGLYYNNNLVSLMTFGKSRYDKNVEYELIRFCSKLNTTVIGGGSKIIKYFENKYKPKSLISYANKRWSKGDLYEQLGFEYIGDSDKNYFYFKVNENILYSRQMFQKHKLETILEIFDKSLSEEQNMFNNNYRKIYDYGNKKYIKYYNRD